MLTARCLVSLNCTAKSKRLEESQKPVHLASHSWAFLLLLKRKHDPQTKRERERESTGGQEAIHLSGAVKNENECVQVWKCYVAECACATVSGRRLELGDFSRKDVSLSRMWRQSVTPCSCCVCVCGCTASVYKVCFSKKKKKHY